MVGNVLSIVSQARRTLAGAKTIGKFKAVRDSGHSAMVESQLVRHDRTFTPQVVLGGTI